MRRLFLVLVLVACGKSNDQKKSAPAAEPKAITNHELATTPLANVASQAGGVAFTIDLPVSQLKPAEVKDAYSTWEPTHAWFDTPDFTVTFSDLPMSADDTGDAQPLGDDAKDRTIARAEKLPDGGYLNLDQRNDHAFFNLEVCRPVPKGTLCCSVIQRSEKPLAAFDEIVGLAEKVCKSMKPKG